MVQKIPPPPYLTGELQQLNRWLIEIQAILNDAGTISPGQVDGLVQVIADTAANTAAIAALSLTVDSNVIDIASINGQIAAINLQIATINGQLTTLGARAQVLNGVGAPAAGLGNVNDWYANIGGAVGARIYVKTAVATWTAFPF